MECACVVLASSLTLLHTHADARLMATVVELRYGSVRSVASSPASGSLADPVVAIPLTIGGGAEALVAVLAGSTLMTTSVDVSSHSSQWTGDRILWIHLPVQGSPMACLFVLVRSDVACTTLVSRLTSWGLR